MKLLPLGLTLAVLAACGAKSTDDTDTTGTTAGAMTTGGPGGTLEPTTGGAPDACTCVEAGDCGPELCASVGLTCDDECVNDEPVSDEVALQCALVALRDRTPGSVGWFSSTLSGQFSRNTTLTIRADGTATVTRTADQDLCSSFGPQTHSSLQEPAYFEACLEESDPHMRLTCLKGALLDELFECAPLYETCNGV